MQVPLIAAEADLTGLATVALVIATVLLVGVTLWGIYYATRVRPRLKISATCDSTRSVKVEVFNGGKEEIQIHRIDFAARGWWAARLLRWLFLRGPWEPVMSTAVATPAGVQDVASGKTGEWRIAVPDLRDWRQSPTVLHPLSTERRGKVSGWRLVLRIDRGQNHRYRYLWYKRFPRLRRIRRVSHEFG